MSELLSTISTIIALSVSFGNLIVLVYALTKFLNRPNKSQNDRLAEHDKRFDEHEKRFEVIEIRLDNGTVHFKALDEGTAVTQTALVAIMNALVPLVPDENKKELKEKRDDLFEYLIDK